MISMENWATQAHEKLSEEAKKVAGQKEKAMAGAVMEAIQLFCRQEAEFAQAVVQGGTFGECMKQVAAGVGSSISDLEAYRKAVQFYFPGAQVHMVLTIDLVGEAQQSPEAEAAPAPDAQRSHEGKVLTLDLDDLFSF